ncbi:MAG: hypothetical protein WDN08_05275 [Rhizomicrobium sp.]
MTYIMEWPAGVLPPQPLNEQYQVKPADAVSRVGFEQGLARQRLANTTALGNYSLMWPMTPRQKYIFDGIVKNELANGAKWFLIDVFTHASYQQLLVRFVKGSIKPVRSGGEWMVSAQLETYGSQVPSGAETDAAIVALGGAPFAGGGLYEWPSDVLSPAPLNEQYQIEPGDTLNRGDFAQGASDQLSSYVNAPGLYTLVWPLSLQQKFIFDGVLEHRLKKGAAPFLLDLFVNDDYRPTKVRLVKGSLTYTRSGEDWIVAVQVETDDLQAPSASETAAAMLTIGGDDLDAMVELLHTIVHVDYPAAVP